MPILNDWGGGVGYPIPGQDGGGAPSQVRVRGTWGQGQDRGYPNQNSTACTCYAMGGMPLTFTPDFLSVSFST